MSNDKTLATVKHGGCVQLEDGLPPLPIRQRFTTLHGETYAYSAEQMQDYARAALSAQPSPGGQDALLASLVARWRKDAEEIGASNNMLCQKIANCTMRHAAELQAALAARQPETDEQYADEQALIDHLDSLMDDGGQGGEKWEPAQAAIAGIIAARQPVGNEPAFYLSAGAWGHIRVPMTPTRDVKAFRHGFDHGDTELVPFYAAPPAQAVDLGPVRAALQAAEALCVCCASVDGYSRGELNAFGQNMRSQFTDALALIDSQAVGNG